MKKACLSSMVPPLPAVSWCGRVSRGVLAMFLAAPVLAWGAAPPADSHYSLRTRKEPRTTRAYLPTVGPIPLRIRRPAAPSVPVVLPPLAMRDPDAASPTRTNLVAEIPTEPAKSSAEDSADAGVSGGEGNNALDPGGSDRNVSPIVTPGMLVQYFKPAGTNTIGGVISVPVFVPASPPPASAVPGGNVSSATYRLK